MRAAILHGFNDLRVEEVPTPAPGPGEVRVRVNVVQPSVTEAMLIAGHRVALHENLQRRISDHGSTAFGGHEFAGTISAIGPGVTTWSEGDRVTGVETVDCTTCAYCTRRHGVICSQPQFLGFTIAGAFAEELCLPAANLVRIPDSVSDAQAAAIQPLVGAIHGQDIASLRSGETVLVTGTGVMGLLAIQLARQHGAGFVVATGRSKNKRDLAASFGADVVLDATNGDVSDQARELTDGAGFDVVIETAGGATAAGLAGTDSTVTAVNSARYGGRIVMVSVLEDGADFPLSRVREKGLALLHPTSGRGMSSPTVDSFELALGFVERQVVNVDRLITHTLQGVDQIPTAVDMTLNKGAHGAINPPQVALHDE